MKKNTPNPVKAVKPVAMKTIAHVDEALANISTLKAEVQKLDADMKLRIGKIKDELEGKASPLMDKIAALAAGIEAFAEANKKTLFTKEERSRKLVFGTIGYRQSSEILVAEKTIAELKKLDLFEAITTKETPNKEVLETYDAAILKRVGAKKVTTDNFYYKLKEFSPDKAKKPAKKAA